MAKKQIGRREFIKSGAVAVAAITAIGGGVGYFLNTSGSDYRLVNFLRPPGAIAEDNLIYGCIKCGLCVQICPIQAIKLADGTKGLAYGTPFIDVRDQPCDFSCDSLQCVETCPTAVLNFKPFEKAGGDAIAEYQKDHDFKDPDFNPFKVQIKAMKSAVTMGMAKVNLDTCIATQNKGFKGNPRANNFDGIYRSPYGNNKKATPLNERTFDREICDLCVTECPIGESAIILDERVNEDGTKSFKPIVLDACTGCGVCVMVCPTEKPSIIVEPIKQQSHV